MSSVQILKKLTPSLREIRISLCPISSNSNGVRNFINRYYTGIKDNNPKLPILIRECTGVEPKIWFRFESGKEDHLSLTNLESEQIANLLKDKATKQAN